MQTTLRSPVTFDGVGLHTGKRARVILRPASAEYGIWFRRTDTSGRDPLVPARWDAVSNATLCTLISNDDGVSVSTIEHLMAAIAGTGLSNLLIEIDGPEVPILDGSAAPFVAGILGKGIVAQDAPRRALQILEPVEVRNGPASAKLLPADTLEIGFEIDFASGAIGRQSKHLNMANGAFVHELCDSRTFCLQSDVEVMWSRGLALGGQPGINAVVFGGDDVVSPGGLRHADEPVRHKMLDALGDLYLAGAPLLARYEGVRAGHALTNALLRALFARPQAFRMVDCDAACAARLPGSGVTRDDLPLVA